MLVLLTLFASIVLLATGAVAWAKYGSTVIGKVRDLANGS